MTILPTKFQLIVPVPHAPFAALGVLCREEKILSIDYLPFGYGEKQLTEDRPQGSAVVEKLDCRLRAYFDQPSPDSFDALRDLPLCKSMIAQRKTETVQRLEYSGEKCSAHLLTPDDCVKILDAVAETPYGETRPYKCIGKEVKWGDRGQAIFDAYREHDSGIGNPHAKAVGDACAVNPHAVVVPCFRAIFSNGVRGGFKGNPYVDDETGKAAKSWLIDRELG